MIITAYFEQLRKNNEKKKRSYDEKAENYKKATSTRYLHHLYYKEFTYISESKFEDNRFRLYFFEEEVHPIVPFTVGFADASDYSYIDETWEEFLPDFEVVTYRCEFHIFDKEEAKFKTISYFDCIIIKDNTQYICPYLINQYGRLCDNAYTHDEQQELYADNYICGIQTIELSYSAFYDLYTTNSVENIEINTTSTERYKLKIYLK